MLDTFFSQPGTEQFDRNVSKASILGVLFYVFAASVWLLERLFNQHLNDIEKAIRELKPHTLRWYRNKTMEFMAGFELQFETDIYQIEGVSDELITKAKVVKYCAVSEAVDSSVLYIKVAGESNGKRTELSPEHEIGLRAYLSHIKDVGIKIQLVNRPADDLKLSLKVFYDPMILTSQGQRIDGSFTTPVQDAIRAYIENLPFNGEYTNVELVDVLQQVPGVVIPEVLGSWSKFGGNEFVKIQAKTKPDAGYFTILDSNLTITWEAYNASDL